MTKHQMLKYERLLKELKKGNSLLAEVSLLDHYKSDIRYRIITPIGCEYADIEIRMDTLGNKYIHHNSFYKSCFIKHFPKKTINPDFIVSRMMEYDDYVNYRVISFIVLK